MSGCARLGAPEGTAGRRQSFALAGIDLQVPPCAADWASESENLIPLQECVAGCFVVGGALVRTA